MNTYTRISNLIKSILIAVAVVAPGFGCYAESPTVSKLASGRWVKVKLAASGMHQITDEQLRQWGFSNPAKVGIYGLPALSLTDYTLLPDRATDLLPVPCVHQEGKLIFYGSADVELEGYYGAYPATTSSSTTNYARVIRNYYADYGTYFLTDSHPAAAPATVAYTGPAYDPATEIPSLKTSALALSLYENEVHNDAKLGARYWDELIEDENEHEIPISLPGFEPSLGEVRMMFMFGHCATNNTSQPFTMPSGANTGSRIYLTSKKSDVIWLYGQSMFVQDNHNESSLITKTENDIYPVKFTKSFSGRFAFDYISSLYPTYLSLNGRSQAKFAATDLKDSDIFMVQGNGGAESDVQVWDVTDRMSPRQLNTGKVGDTGGRLFSSPGNFDANRQYTHLAVFEPKETLLGVEFAEIVENQNLHGMDVPHMLIITASDFLDQANRLAKIHNDYNGIDVAVVTPEEIYNEFSGGTPMIMGMRSFISMLYERNPQKFRSVLIIGAAYWDNRYLDPATPATEMCKRYVPMFLCEQGNMVGSYPQSYKTDAFLGMLDYNTSYPNFEKARMTIGVGRIPVPSVSALKTYVDKVEKYLNTPPSTEIYNRVLLTSDSGDSNAHMNDADQLADDAVLLNSGITAYKASNAVTPFDNGTATHVTEKIKNTLHRGVSFMSFSGHSLSITAVGAGNVWNVGHVNDTDNDVLPLVFLSTCNGIDPTQDSNSLSEAMLSKNNGGAIGVVSACRSVYQNRNQDFAREVLEKYFLPLPGATFGTMIRDAHNGLIDDLSSPQFQSRQAAALINRHAYNLYGDPEIPINQATNKVRMAAVNGQSINAGDAVKITGGTIANFEGEVTDLNGNIDSNFNGEIRITIFDCPIYLNVINTDISKQVQSPYDESELATVTTVVTNGKFAVDLYVPEPHSLVKTALDTNEKPQTIDQRTNRVQFFAWNADRNARDGWTGLTVLPTDDPSTADSDATEPEISAMYIDSTDFTNGDTFDNNAATLYAEVESNALGIISTSGRPGKSVTLILDNSRPLSHAASYFNVGSDGAGKLQFPLPSLADGPHSLTFSVSNAAGQTSSRTIAFNIVSKPLEAKLSVEEYPARTSATINLDTPHTSLEGRLIVKNAKGDVVHSVVDPSFPYSWNLKNAADTDVEAGVYTVEAYLRTDNKFGSATPAEFVVYKE